MKKTKQYNASLQILGVEQCSLREKTKKNAI